MSLKGPALPDVDEQAQLVVSRRALIRGITYSFVAGSVLLARSAKGQSSPQSRNEPDLRLAWVCPMHPDYISFSSGACPLCGMALVEARPFDVRDYRLDFYTAPALVRSEQTTSLYFKAFSPGSDTPVKSFYWVHTKQWHLFVISQDMEFWEHIHPVMAADGTWSIEVTLPKPGNYITLSDFFPSGGTAQLLVRPLTTAGYAGDLFADSAHLLPDPIPMTKTVGNLSATISLDPPRLVAGDLSRINFHLTDARTHEPVTDLQTYLGAFGHALIMSEDMLDYIHVHPVNIVPGSQEDGAPPIFFIPPDADLEKIRGGPNVALEALLPRPGRYRVWIQMRRNDEVRTFVFNLKVSSLA